MTGWTTRGLFEFFPEILLLKDLSHAQRIVGQRTENRDTGKHYLFKCSHDGSME